MPSIRVVDVIVVCTKGGRTGTTESDGRGVDACGGSTSATGSTEGSLRGGEKRAYLPAEGALDGLI